MANDFKSTFMLFLIALFLSGGGLLADPPLERPQKWEGYALRLSGESDAVARHSVGELKAFPHLENALRAALQEKSTRYFLALDVISTLKLRSLLPDLVAASAKDPSGFAYIALNAFFNSTSARDLAALYVNRLDDPASSTPAKMVLIDTLGRLQVAIGDEGLRKLLGDSSSPELRSAALYYARSFLLRGDLRYLELFKKLRGASRNEASPSFRAQIQFLSEELALHD